MNNKRGNSYAIIFNSDGPIAQNPEWTQLLADFIRTIRCQRVYQKRTRHTAGLI